VLLRAHLAETRDGWYLCCLIMKSHNNNIYIQLNNKNKAKHHSKPQLNNEELEPNRYVEQCKYASPAFMMQEH
jgi:hypothetical protein